MFYSVNKVYYKVFRTNANNVSNFSHEKLKWQIIFSHSYDVNKMFFFVS